MVDAPSVQTVPLKEVSKLASHALRHAPETYGLTLDGEGWTPVDHLLAAMHAQGAAWENVTEDTLAEMINISAKTRHELDRDGHRIRALYGHSVDSRIVGSNAVPPPDVLMHSTPRATLDTILHEGLRPMSRQDVHMSPDSAIALEVGRRHDRNPVLLRIDAAAAAAAGVEFRRGNDKVWMAESVPPEFIKVVELENKLKS